SLFVTKLVEYRWVLVALAILLAALAWAGTTDPVAAAGVFAAAAALLILLPRTPVPGGTHAVTQDRGRAEAEQLLGRLVEALPDPSLILDRRGVIRWVNQRAA